MGGGTETDCHKMLPLPRLLSKTGSGIRGHAYAPVSINLPSSPFVSHTALVERFWRGYGKHHCVPRSRTTFLFPPLSWHASSYDREKIERLARGKIHSTLFFATRECVNVYVSSEKRLFEKVVVARTFHASFPLLPFSFLKTFDRRSLFP